MFRSSSTVAGGLTQSWNLLSYSFNSLDQHPQQMLSFLWKDGKKTRVQTHGASADCHTSLQQNTGSNRIHCHIDMAMSLAWARSKNCEAWWPDLVTRCCGALTHHCTTPVSQGVPGDRLEPAGVWAKELRDRPMHLLVWDHQPM